jgi:Flp pilus assembly protein TadD
MQRPDTTKRIRTALLACVSLAIVGCNTTPTQEVPAVTEAVPARLEIQESVGFTIVEAAPIEGAVRLDYDRAHDLLNQGKVEEGIALLETVAEAAPELSAPRIDLGIAYHRSGNFEAAETELKQALNINVAHPVALNELGIVYRKTARFDDARRSYEAALNVYPGFHYARRNLAVLCDLYLDDLDCALENYEAYVAMVSSDDEAATWYKNVRFRAGKTE